MGDLSRGLGAALDRLLVVRGFAAAYILGLLAVGAALIVLETPLANLTDEDEYMPYALGDLLAGRNPYATVHSQAVHVESRFTTRETQWSTVYPYLPVLAVLQLPLVDYRWTALAAYGLLLWFLRGRPWAFFAFANPILLPLASSGFNDLVVLALLAASLHPRSRWVAWLAAGAKQLALPLLLVDHGLRREFPAIARLLAATAFLLLPFVLWDAAAFWDAAVAQHLRGESAKLPGLLEGQHVNYYLYPWFFGFVLWPRVRPARSRRTPSAAPASSTPRSLGPS